MPDLPIGGLPPALPVQEGDLFALEQAADTVKLSVNELRDSMQGNIIPVVKSAALLGGRGVLFVDLPVLISTTTPVDCSLLTNQFLMPTLGNVLIRQYIQWLQGPTFMGPSLYVVSFTIDSGFSAGLGACFFSGVAGQPLNFTGNACVENYVTNVSAGMRTLHYFARKFDPASPDIFIGAVRSGFVIDVDYVLLAPQVDVLAPVIVRILEDGDFRITEDGEFRILE